MKNANYLVVIGVAAAAGTAVGLLTGGKHPAKGGLLGALAGAVAGSLAAGVYAAASREDFPYYSSSSPLYEELETV